MNLKVIEKIFDSYGIELNKDKDGDIYVNTYNLQTEESNEHFIDCSDINNMSDYLNISTETFNEDYFNYEEELILEKERKKEERALKRSKNILIKKIEIEFPQSEALSFLENIPETALNYIINDNLFTFDETKTKTENLKELVESYFKNFINIDEVKELKNYWKDLEKDALVREKSFLQENYLNYHKVCSDLSEKSGKTIKENENECFKNSFDKKLTPEEAVKKYLNTDKNTEIKINR